jgi:hypothetical protein
LDKQAIIERLGALRREASEIKAVNRVYQARSAHTKLEMELHEGRRQRLEEIRREARAMVRHPSAQNGHPFSEQQGEGQPKD